MTGPVGACGWLAGIAANAGEAEDGELVEEEEEVFAVAEAEAEEPCGTLPFLACVLWVRSIGEPRPEALPLAAVTAAWGSRDLDAAWLTSMGSDSGTLPSGNAAL